MQLNHVGIVNGNEDQAVRFYGGILGFEKTREFTVSPDLSEQLFSVDRPIKVLVFERDGIKLELFIAEGYRPPSPDYAHIGLVLKDFPAFLDKCRREGAEMITGTSGEKTVHFMKDFAGNLIEIKSL